MGDIVHSFTMLTINAEHHALMRQFHKPADEKRMVVILPEERYDDWLRADAQHSADFLQPYPADRLEGLAATRNSPADNDPAEGKSA